jgi:hypothetical protein
MRCYAAFSLPDPCLRLLGSDILQKNLNLINRFLLALCYLTTYFARVRNLMIVGRNWVLDVNIDKETRCLPKMWVSRSADLLLIRMERRWRH